MLFYIMYFVLFILFTLFVIIRSFCGKNTHYGGSREAIFSRFEYQPDFPMISQLDTVNFNQFSKIYNTGDDTKFIMGRPYRYYHTKNSTWTYPWTFPQEIDRYCIQKASSTCGDKFVQIKQPDEKLSGLGADTPKDIFIPSKCFNQTYNDCQEKRSSP